MNDTITYDLLLGCTELLLDTVKNKISITGIVAGAKSLGVSFILINFICIMIKAKGDKENKSKLSLSFIVINTLFIVMICTTDTITAMIDTLGLSLKNSIEMGEFQNVTVLSEITRIMSAEQSEDPSFWDSVEMTIAHTISMFDPLNIVVALLKIIAYFVELFVLPMIYIVRSFSLLVYQILLPFVFAIATFEPLRPMVLNVLKGYLILVLLPLMWLIADSFGSAFITIAQANMVSLEGTIVLGILNDKYIGLLVSLSFAKVALYKQSSTILKSLFDHR